MPRLWDLLDYLSKAVCHKVAGKRWRDPDKPPDLDELPESETAREMQRRPTGKTAVL